MAIELKDVQIICTVEAVYPFHSEDATTLNFNVGDQIDVFTKLETGWWNGWCNGRRGWFPSNYVEVISEGDYRTQMLPPRPNIRKQSIDNYRLSAVTSSTASYENRNNMGDHWNPAGSNDEQPWLLFNERAGEPIIQNTDYLNIENAITDQKYNKRDSYTDQSEIDIHENQETQVSKDELMENWVERKTPQGRSYFCNLLTQETTWDYDEIDPETGRLRKSQEESEESALEDSEDEQEVKPSTTEEVKNEITWNKLATDIALGIHQLVAATQSGDPDELYTTTAAIVKSIRMMLYASRALDKDTHLLSNPAFREPRKSVISTLSKLVLSTKMGIDAPQTSTPVLVQKIQRDANELQLAVRNFITLCTQHDISIENANPKLVNNISKLPFDASISNNMNSKANNGSTLTSKMNLKRHNSDLDTDNSLAQKTKFYLNQDLISNLKAYTNQLFSFIDELSLIMLKSLEKYTQGIEKHELDEERFESVVMFKTLASQLSLFIGRLDEINFENNTNAVSSDNFNTYRNHRQSLYESIGYLFAAIQCLTDANVDIEKTAKSVDESLIKVGSALESIEQIIVIMVNERKRNKSIAKDDYLAIPPNESRYAQSITSSLNDGDASSFIQKPRSIHQEGNILFDETRQSSIDFLESKFPSPPTREQNGDIEFGITDNAVKGGTLSALIERLTAHDIFDTAFIATFLLTYRSFCTTETFISLLEERYNILPPENFTPEQFEVWAERKQKLIRLRVFNVLKNWLENYYIDEDAYLLPRIEHFTSTTINDASTFAANQLLKIIKRRTELNSQGMMKNFIPNPISGPEPIIPKNISNIQLLETDPIEMARQLSVMDFKLYSSIRPIECLGKAWSKDDSGTIAINIKKSIHYCNRLTAWVSESILQPEESKKRAVVIKYWVQVAENCRTMNNFNTCMAILSAFDNSAIGRLKKTWNVINRATAQTLAQIRKLMGANRNFTEYREIIHSVNPPCIPFLGIYLQDLTFIEDGNPDYLVREPTSLINFGKRQKTAEVILELKQFQSTAYNFHSIPEFQNFIQSRLDISYDVEVLYERSLKLEPRASDISAAAINNVIVSLV